MTNSTLHLPFNEILKSIPGFFGIRLEEEPRFEVLEKDHAIEVRKYAPALLAEVTLKEKHDEALDQAFDILAKYIFGENTSRQSLPMTTPVRQKSGVTLEMTTPVLQRPDGGEWTVSFFLGNDMSKESAPVPNDPRITLRREDEKTVAVARYSGNNDDQRRTEARRELLAWVEKSRWNVDGSVSWAQYDAPFVIPFLKRNEVQVEVTSASKAD